MRNALPALVVLLATQPLAHAQDFPSKPIRIVAAAAPGGGVDTTSRVVAEQLQGALGQGGIVENRPGAGGAVGGDLVARSPADGHTLLTISISHSVLPSSHKNLSYSPEKDLAAVTVMVNAPNVLVANPSLPANNIQELIAFAKKRPGEINYASSGNASPSHLATEYLGLLSGIDLTHIPYKGTGPGITDVIAGRVSLMFASVISTRSHIEAGKLKPLAMAGAKRAKAAPDIPTIGETVPGYAVDVWYAMLAPAGTPRPVMEKLNKAVTSILHRPEVTQKLGAIGLEPVGEGLAESQAYIDAEIRKWAKVVKAAKITAN